MLTACDSLSIRTIIKIATITSGCRAMKDIASITPHAISLAILRIVCFIFCIFFCGFLCWLFFPSVDSLPIRKVLSP